MWFSAEAGLSVPKGTFHLGGIRRLCGTVVTAVAIEQESCAAGNPRLLGTMCGMIRVTGNDAIAMPLIQNTLR